MSPDDSTTIEDDLNPFVCTLGEAAVRNEGRKHPFPTLFDLIEGQAAQNPAAYAIGFATRLAGPNDEPGDYEALSPSARKMCPARF